MKRQSKTKRDDSDKRYASAVAVDVTDKTVHAAASSNLSISSRGSERRDCDGRADNEVLNLDRDEECGTVSHDGSMNESSEIGAGRIMSWEKITSKRFSGPSKGGILLSGKELIGSSDENCGRENEGGGGGGGMTICCEMER